MATQFAIPLIGAAVSTTSSAPATGTINRYDATSGALTPTLSALSGTSVGASMVVQKTDASANTVTVTCAGADTFIDGTTTLVLKAGDQHTIQCVSVSSTKYWERTSSSGGASVAPLVPTAVKTTTYTAAVNDLVPVDATSAGFTVTLPTAPVDKSRISLKKIDSTANTVTIAAGGSDVFNKTGGPTTLSMVVQNQAVTLQYATSSSIWYVTVNDAPVATLDTRYLGISATAAAATKSVGQWAPTDQNFIAWSFDPAAASSSQVPASGTVWVVGLKVPAGTITNVILNIATAGATLTAGQCFAGLYQGGTLLAATADQAASWVSAGVKTMALTSPQTVTAGMVYVAYFSNGTTNPAFSRGNNTAAVNAGLGTAYRYATADTGRTTTFASTLGTLTSLNAAVWAAVS